MKDSVGERSNNSNLCRSAFGQNTIRIQEHFSEFIRNYQFWRIYMSNIFWNFRRNSEKFHENQCKILFKFVENCWAIVFSDIWINTRKNWMQFCWDFQFRGMQRNGNLVDPEKCWKINIWTQASASIQKITSPVNFDHLADKSEKDPVPNLSTMPYNPRSPLFAVAATLTRFNADRFGHLSLLSSSE